MKVTKHADTSFGTALDYHCSGLSTFLAVCNENSSERKRSQKDSTVVMRSSVFGSVNVALCINFFGRLQAYHSFGISDTYAFFCSAVRGQEERCLSRTLFVPEKWTFKTFEKKLIT